MTNWRLLHVWDRDPALQMGFDDLLLSTPDTPPTLRFYTWQPAGLSLGYFQKLDEVPAAAKALAQKDRDPRDANTGTDPEFVVVRRQTGGGAIHHVDELTFALCADLDDPLFAGSVGESYERVHDAIAATLATYGIDARRKSRWGDGSTQALTSDRPGTGMCFHASTDLDLCWDGAKGVGSAQRRKRGRCLHHGSIKLAPSALDTHVAAVGPYAPDLTLAELTHDLTGRLTSRFAEAFGWDLAASDASPSELDDARRLGRAFAATGFVRRR